MSRRFQEAFIYSCQLHANQRRKGSDIPYISHLLAVAALVMEDGADEDQVIAALLHDAVEDQGGKKTLEEIHRRFGDRVARIVEGCSDSFGYPKLPWKERKEKYIQHLTTAETDIARVSLADKVHNARSLLLDLSEETEFDWSKFNGGKKGTLWYYRTLVGVFKQVSFSPLIRVFEETVKNIIEKAD